MGTNQIVRFDRLKPCSAGTEIDPPAEDVVCRPKNGRKMVTMHQLLEVMSNEIRFLGGEVLYLSICSVR